MPTRALSAAVVISAVVVIVFAVLQYRWSNQVSEATGVRLADTLQLSMINWHLDLLRNFSELCLIVRIPADRGAGGDLRTYVGQFAEWRAVARYPDLVSNVYLLASDDVASSRALRLDSSAQQFVPDEWSSRLAPLREAMQHASTDVIVPLPGSEEPQSEAASRRFVESYYNIGDALRGWRFEPTTPALLHPVPPDPAASAGIATTERAAPDWLVIELNDRVIQNKILPDLAHRYFQGTDGLDYQVAVVAGRSPRHVIYSSDSGFGQEDVSDADGTMDVFGRVRDKALGSPLYVFHQPSENRGPATAVGISWFPLLGDIPAEQDWQLLVRHRRGGPLGAFVADMHRRDLAISFGALLLLVISMAMLIVTSNRAQRLAKLQMDFVTAVSHELRTPLTVISSAADNIAHGVVEGKHQVRQYGSVIASQVRQLSGLVEQILLFAATRESQQRYSLQALEVSEIIDATLASTAGLLEASQFTVDRELEPNLPRVTGDLLALSQCLQNLITNALKYGSEHRWIGIRAGLAEGMSGKEVQISVSDRGIGIASADLPHIFEPFYRSPSAAAAQIHGTGLGLSLAKQIAEAMKGQLDGTSVPGHGSTFTLHLPCTEPQPVESEPEASVASLDRRRDTPTPQ